MPFVRELPKDSTSSKVKAKEGAKGAPKEAKKAVEQGQGVAKVAKGVEDLKLDGKGDGK